MVRSVRGSMKEIFTYLDHKSVQVTERVYAKYSPDFQKESTSVKGDYLTTVVVQVVVHKVLHTTIIVNKIRIFMK